MPLSEAHAGAGAPTGRAPGFLGSLTLDHPPAADQLAKAREHGTNYLAHEYVNRSTPSSPLVEERRSISRRN